MDDESIITSNENVQDIAPSEETLPESAPVQPAPAPAAEPAPIAEPAPVMEPAPEPQPASEPQPKSAPEAEPAPVPEPPTPAVSSPESGPAIQETHDTLPPIRSPQQETAIERVREPNEAEKEQIFQSRLRSLSPKGVSARRTTREENYEKILAHLKAHGYISNKEVESLCKVKDAAATAYLRELARRGMVTKIGRGRASRYRLTQAIG